ncbi:MAG: AAA family ATPase [Planctomycetes bacterium]|nr:AAA family ATPase [Planctomycetota bacterium]
MYLNHWSLKRSPFDARPDSRFLFATEQHEQALAAISYAACEGGEPVLLRGQAGCGKTLLLRTLRRRLPRERFQVTFVPEVACSEVGLLKRVAYHLTHTLADDPAAAIDTILRQVRDGGQRGRSIVLMFDNWPAQAAPGMLEELRWLLNLDIEEGCRVDVLLAGEEVRPRKHWPAWLVQRLFTTVQIGPLAGTEVLPYLVHRLAVAAGETDGQERGSHTEPPCRAACDAFSPDAVELIGDWSDGVPRLINRAAHLALHVAYLDLARRVEPDHVRRAVARMTRDSLEPAGAIP